MTENFDTKLQALRDRFIENLPQNQEDNSKQLTAFSIVSIDEKLGKISTELQFLSEKEALLSEKLSSLQSTDNSAEIKEELRRILDKREILKHKQELLKNSELEMSKREKMKRQLVQLEIKRCKNQLEKKDCDKIDAKIEQKKKIFKKVFG
ncbi:MAG: hypothetical protein LBV19_04150 [Streptococcaceae bacterium]|jgi:hypothetical protein|nr:hypothetical protein [Streptococcaceae bacterium]